MSGAASSQLNNREGSVSVANSQPYRNVHTTICRPILNKSAKWGVPRLGNLVVIPLQIGTAVIDTGIGVITGIFALIFDIKPTIVANHLECSQLILSRTFLCVLKFIDPSLGPDRSAKYGPKLTISCRYARDGILTRYVKTFFTEIASAAKGPDEKDNKHPIISRLSYLAGGLLSIITRIFDLVLGVPAVLLVLMSIGRCEKLNAFAFRGLQIGGILNDIFFTIRNIQEPGNVEQRKEGPKVLVIANDYFQKVFSSKEITA